MNNFTILGGSGWIGSALVNYLKSMNLSVSQIERENLSCWLKKPTCSGPVIYAIGTTSDFRETPLATCEAHVEILKNVLKCQKIKQLLYLSSTRVYSRCSETSELTPVPCLSSDSSDLYNLSKLLGESLVLQDSRPGMRVIRLSNVIGHNQPVTTFIGSLFAEAKATGHVVIRQAPDTAKDYIDLKDVVQILPKIAVHAKKRLYNVASGNNTSHFEIAAWLTKQGVKVKFAKKKDPSIKFIPIDTNRLRTEFGKIKNPFSKKNINISI